MKTKTVNGVECVAVGEFMSSSQDRAIMKLFKDMGMAENLCSACPISGLNGQPDKCDTIHCPGLFIVRADLAPFIVMRGIPLVEFR